MPIKQEIYNTIKVLIVDDDEEDFFIIKKLLNKEKNRNYFVQWSSNYKESLELILNDDFDVFLIDYRLGGKSGLELIKESKEKLADKPFILLTGQGSEDIDEIALKLGVSDYFDKDKIFAFPGLLDRSIRYTIEHYKNIEKIKELNTELENRVKERTEELSNTVKALEESSAKLELEFQNKKMAEKALIENQVFISAIVRNFPNGMIVVLNRSLDFIFADGKELQNLGISEKDLMGKSFLNFISSQNEEIKSQFHSKLKESIRGKNTFQEIFFRNTFFEVYTLPLRESDHSISKILVVFQNINNRKQAEQEIQKSLEKEKELNELKSRFVSMASHEFRTPLATILSSTTLISKYQESNADERIKKHISRIKSSVNNLTQILNDFLSLSKLEEGKIQNIPTKFKIKEFCKEIIEEINFLMKEDQELVESLKCENDDFEIFLDKQLIRNVIYNLLSNAIKYSDNQDKIFFTLNQKEKSIEFIIKDQGIGIPMEEQNQMFERFFRAKNAVNIQGTGLGLNIVKKYIDLMNGEISFESEANVGTTFKVEIPI
jgi:PAS domain S-box-containing protein